MPSLSPVETTSHLVDAWNAQSEAERNASLTRAVAPDVVYVDPHAPAPVAGRQGLADLIGFFRTRFDHALLVDGTVDTHNGFLRFAWRLERPNGDRLSRGMTFGEVNADGQLTRIVQFVDRA